MELYIKEWTPTQDVLDSLQYALMGDSGSPGTPPVHGHNSNVLRQQAVENRLTTGTALTLTLVLMQPGQCWVVGEVLAEWGKTLLQITLHGMFFFLGWAWFVKVCSLTECFRCTRS